MRPAVDFIAELRQARDLGALPVGRRVVVIGGGMTAIDAGVQAKKLGAEEVTIVYRRGARADGGERLRAGAGGERGGADRLQRRAGRGERRRGMVFAYADGDGAAGATSASSWRRTRC